ncbi:hypothetical protein M409DRAFT_18540 [Zasmidium cellare ATCC 36951]|uniref:SMP-30/Gluconolactonase/LRE-like region domain-containing protein n=1 Tax=Zasmidium cellare ATCC 36951 TaxID=1080233 RepID=A0A6A6CXI7_ZASCE|nr:uncharacterized protein M409DRAFT_18540 [Zasmidium cellare ATCC 36951]KAF2171423.1 hypothetical protein M409DRAFT_18540 [Zasmidium cellare ATCC 36951]
MELPSLFALFTICSLCLAAPQPIAANSAAAVPVQPETIYTFNSSFIPENTLLRNNNQLLVTCTTCPYIFQLDPTQGQDQTPKLVHTFNGYGSVTGIVQLQKDVFAVSVGNYTISGGPVNGTWNIWLLDLRSYVPPSYDPSKVTAVLMGSATQATIIDGLAIVNASRGLIAGTDFQQGTIWLTDIALNRTTALITSADLGPNAGGATGPLGRAGVNGLKFRDSRLYFTTTSSGNYGYVPVNTQTGQATGGITTLFDYSFRLDDFNFAASGNVYFTTFDSSPNGGIYRRASGTPAGQNGTTEVIAEYGTNSVIANDTGSGCNVIFSAALRNQVLRARLEGAC